MRSWALLNSAAARLNAFSLISAGTVTTNGTRLSKQSGGTRDAMPMPSHAGGRTILEQRPVRHAYLVRFVKLCPLERVHRVELRLKPATSLRLVSLVDAHRLQLHINLQLALSENLRAAHRTIQRPWVRFPRKAGPKRSEEHRSTLRRNSPRRASWTCEAA